MEGRVSSTLRLPFSSCTSWPSTQFTSVVGRPVFAALNGTSLFDALAVSTLRADGSQVGEELVAGGLLPLRIISATPPFSTIGPSGRSPYGLCRVVAQPPLA